MARLMLTVGDMQVAIAPVAGSISGALLTMPLQDAHPLMVGDHEVLFYETGLGGHRDKVCAAIMGETDAMEVVGAWLTMETRLEVHDTRKRLIELMGKDIEAFMP